jgi:hypothetical protein
MRRMIHQHLQHRALVAPPVLAAAHLDEDSLAAFIEGRLSETESAPVVSHLVACTFCRRVTAQLVRLESEIGPGEISTPAASEEPGRIINRLKELVKRALPSSDEEAVFAYHDPAEDLKQKDETDSAQEQTGEEGAPENRSDPESNK